MSQQTQDQTLLSRLAQSHPDFAAYAAALPSAMETNLALPPEHAQDILSFLSHDPEMAPLIEKWQNEPAGIKTFSLAGTTALTTAVIFFLLRSHIKIHRHDTGKWELFFESKPGEGGSVVDAAKRIYDWLKGSGLFS